MVPNLTALMCVVEIHNLNTTATKCHCFIVKVVNMVTDADQEESALFKGTGITQVLPQSTEEGTTSNKAPKPANKSVTCSVTPRSGENVSLCVSNASGTKTASKASITPNTKSTAESAAVCRTGAPSRVTATSSNRIPPQTESTVVREATCKTAPSSRSEKFPSHQLKTKATPQMAPVAKKPRTSVRPESVETSAKTVHVKNSVGPNASHCHKSNKPGAPHQATGTSVRPEHKKPPTEPPQTSMSNKTKPSEGLPKVGKY